MAAALVAALRVVLLRRVTRCAGLSEVVEECEWVREYELREGRLEGIADTDPRCWLDGLGDSCVDCVNYRQQDGSG